MKLIANTIMLSVLLAHGAPASAAEPEDVQMAYENCVVYMTAMSIEQTDEARKEWASTECVNGREGSCKNPGGNFCDGWVEVYLVKIKTYKDTANIELPH